MSEQLILGLPTADFDSAEWLLVDASGRTQGALEHGPLASAAASVGERRVIVVIGNTEVTRTRCNLPVSGNKLAQALPYALEDQFAEDVESLHFAAGSADDKGEREVAVIAKATLRDCLQTLSAAGIAPAAVYTYHDALTPLDSFVQLLVSDGSVILRAPDGQYAGLADIAPVDVFAAWLATQDTGENAEPIHVRVYCDEAARDRFASDWDAMAGQVADIDIKPMAGGVLPLIARAIGTGRGINLMQGTYSVKTDSLAALRPWIAAAALLSAVLLLSVINRVVDYRALERQSAQLDQELASVLASVRGGSRNSANPEAQLRALLNRNRGGSSSSQASAGSDAAFLNTLSAFAGAAVSNKATDIEAISYRNGVFDVRLTTANASTLEALTRQVSEGGGLSAKIQRTEQQDDAVKSFVQISQVAP